MNQIHIYKHAVQNNLNFKELINKLKTEKIVGHKYFREKVNELKPHSKIQLFEYKKKPSVELITHDEIPLLPIPIKRHSYQKLKNKFELLEELAVAKISFTKKGYRPQQINIERKLIKQTIQLIYKYYEYDNPYQGKEIIWVDLKPEILKTLNNCTKNNLNGIINGLLIKTS